MTTTTPQPRSETIAAEQSTLAPKQALPSVMAMIGLSPAVPAVGSATRDPLFWQVMDYRFPPLLDRLCDKEGLGPDMAVKLFGDMLKFLYLCGTKSSTDGRFSPPEAIDIAWHHFLMFTREYARFCDVYFGQFIHHTPYTRSERVQMMASDNPRSSVQRSIDKAALLFGSLSPAWFAIGLDSESGMLLHGCADCSGSTNCGGNDPPCC